MIMLAALCAGCYYNAPDSAAVSDSTAGSVSDSHFEPDANVERCEVTLPAETQVALEMDNFHGSVWVCEGVSAVASGSNGTYFLEPGALLNVSGSKSVAYVKRDATFTATGSNCEVFYEEGAELSVHNDSCTYTLCGELVFDSSQLNEGCP